MPIEMNERKVLTKSRRWWQAAFAMLLSTILVLEAAPQLTANAFFFIEDEMTELVSGAEPVNPDQILYTGLKPGDAAPVLAADQKVTILAGETERYATTRRDESVSDLLLRSGIGVEENELVRVEDSADGILMTIASDFTISETVEETAAFQTVYIPDCTLPKGTEIVNRAGENGIRTVTYEVVYQDGAPVSRVELSSEESGVIDAEVVVGTLVREAQPGDTIAEVISEADGGGYLILQSGDSLHFTGSMDVKCTAYTANVGKVGTITYTGTKVHEGVVAVDKSVIPLGSWMFVTTMDGSYTYGMGHAEDTGVRGKSVDLYMDTYDECMQFGRRSSVVYFLDNPED